MASQPTHLEPSALGTREYWDALYTSELSNHAANPSDTGTVWFDDSDAEAKLVSFLSDRAGHPSKLSRDGTSFIDLGCGNGSLLFALRAAGWCGPMLGVDYSAQSVALAQRIAAAPPPRDDGDDNDSNRNDEDDGNNNNNNKNNNSNNNNNNNNGGNGNDDDDYNNNSDNHNHNHNHNHNSINTNTNNDDGSDDNDDNSGAEHKQQSTKQNQAPHAHKPTSPEPPTFLQWDIIAGPYDTVLTGDQSPGWDVVLDKGTFDAISLSGELNADGRRISELYRDRVLRLLRPGGLLLITSCNWTEAELGGWFEAPGGGGEGKLLVDGRVDYRSFSFGGVKGQTISSLCFRKETETP